MSVRPKTHGREKSRKCHCRSAVVMLSAVAGAATDARSSPWSWCASDRCACAFAVRRWWQWTTTPINAHRHASDSDSGGKKVSSAQGRRRITRGRHSSRAKSIRASTPLPYSHPIPYNRSHHSAKLYPRASPLPLTAVSCRRRPMRSARRTDWIKPSKMSYRETLDSTARRCFHDIILFLFIAYCV